MIRKSSTVGFIVSFVVHAMIISGVIYSSFTKENVSATEPKILKISLANYTPTVKQEVVTPKPKKIEPKPVVKKVKPKPEPKIIKEIIKEEIVKKEIVEEIEEIIEEIEEVAIIENITEIISNEEVLQEQHIMETVSKDTEIQSTNEPVISKTDFEIIRDMVFANVKYPSMAKRMNITGIVELVLVIDSSGKLLEVLLGQS